MNRRIRAIVQPPETGMCGQACVAMAAGCSLEEAAHAVGLTVIKEPGTLAPDLVKGLRRLGMRVGVCKTYAYKKQVSLMPNFAILKIIDEQLWSHWVLLKGGYIYDPGIGHPIPLWVFESFIIERCYSRGHADKTVNVWWGQVIPILGRQITPPRRPTKRSRKR